MWNFICNLVFLLGLVFALAVLARHFDLPFYLFPLTLPKLG